jgi:uncharacterized OB-fold protein
MKIPIDKELWKQPGTPGKKPRLLGSQCTICGETYFPRKKKGWCLRCHKKTLVDVMLSTKGKIASFTIVEQAPAGGFYKGPVPYAYGFVDLADQVRLKALFTNDFDKLRVGMDVELVIDTLYVDDLGNEVTTFKFHPVATE